MPSLRSCPRPSFSSPPPPPSVAGEYRRRRRHIDSRVGQVEIPPGWRFRISWKHFKKLNGAFKNRTEFSFFARSLDGCECSSKFRLPTWTTGYVVSRFSTERRIFQNCFKFRLPTWTTGYVASRFSTERRIF